MDYNYDVAISFLNDDEDLALTLYNRLKDKLKCFVYTEEQRRLAGSDGEVQLNRIFRKEARLVVILYRGSWGKSNWTKIEETAIRSRSLETASSYDFTLLIKLDSTTAIPEWYPGTMIWIDFTIIGIDETLSIIETRANEAGSTVKILSLADKIAAREKEIKHRQRVKYLLTSPEGVALATDEFRKALAVIESMASEVKEKTTGWHLEVQKNRQNGVEVRSYGYELSFQWNADPLDPYLFVLFVKGYFNDDGTPTAWNPVTRLDYGSYKFHINESEQYGWVKIESDIGFLTSQELIEFWFNQLLDQATRSRERK
jgi:hypothetical protein